MYIGLALALAWWVLHASAERRRSENAGPGPWAEGIDMRHIFAVGRREEYTASGWRLLVAARTCAAAALAVLLWWFFTP